MPKTTYTSPFATAFKSACKRGTPCSQAVWNISKRTGKSPSVIWNSLCKAGICQKQKFNGQWIYWPTDQAFCNTTAKCAKTCQVNMWQSFVEWCIASGQCTPEQLNKHCNGQQNFMKYCRKFFNKQFNTNTTSTSRKGRKTSGGTSSYKFPGRQTSGTRKRQAA